MYVTSKQIKKHWNITLSATIFIAPLWIFALDFYKMLQRRKKAIY